MKETLITKNIKAGGIYPGIVENNRVIVKLESHIEGKMADILRQMLEVGKGSPEYSTLYAKLVKLEEKSGFTYDLSPSRN